MKQAEQLATAYLALWNERDPKRRLDLLASNWTADARYADPLMKGVGAAEISALVGAVHDRFPAFRFRLTGAPDGFEDFARFSWAFGPEQGDAVVEGTDFVRQANGRIASVTGFLDRVPAEA